MVSSSGFRRPLSDIYDCHALEQLQAGQDAEPGLLWDCWMELGATLLNDLLAPCCRTNQNGIAFEKQRRTLVWAHNLSLECGSGGDKGQDGPNPSGAVEEVRAARSFRSILFILFLFLLLSDCVINIASSSGC